MSINIVIIIMIIIIMKNWIELIERDLAVKLANCLQRRRRFIDGPIIKTIFWCSRRSHAWIFSEVT